MLTVHVKIASKPPDGVKPRRVHSSHLSNFRPCESAVPMIFPAKSRLDESFGAEYSLGSCVNSIVDFRSEPQVGGIDATRIVATRTVVTDKEAVGNGSEVQYPTGSVRANRSMLYLASIDMPVSLRSNVASPKPARICNLDLFKEPRRKRFGKTLRSEEVRCYMRLHNQALFGCATLPGCFIQRGKHPKILHTP